MFEYNMIPSQLDDWLYDIEQSFKDRGKRVQRVALSIKHKRIKEVKERIEARLKKKKVLFISSSYLRLRPPIGPPNRTTKNA